MLWVAAPGHRMRYVDILAGGRSCHRTRVPTFTIHAHEPQSNSQGGFPTTLYPRRPDRGGTGRETQLIRPAQHWALGKGQDRHSACWPRSPQRGRAARPSRARRGLQPSLCGRHSCPGRPGPRRSPCAASSSPHARSKPNVPSPATECPGVPLPFLLTVKATLISRTGSKDLLPKNTNMPNFEVKETELGQANSHQRSLLLIGHFRH